MITTLLQILLTVIVATSSKCATSINDLQFILPPILTEHGRSFEDEGIGLAEVLDDRIIVTYTDLTIIVPICK